MAYTILFGVFTLLMLIGTPIAFCLGIASFATVLYLGLPPIVVFQQMNSGMNVFAMMAIPFFIFAGDLMVRGGIAHRLIRFAAGLVGHLHRGFDTVRRHFRLGRRRCFRRRRAHDPANGQARL